MIIRSMNGLYRQLLDDGVGVLVLELLYSDLRGGALMEVYDGDNKASGKLVWRYRNCDITPKPIVLRSGTAFIRYVSDFSTLATDADDNDNNDDDGTIGKGFKAVYWSINSTAKSQIFSLCDGNQWKCTGATPRYVHGVQHIQLHASLVS